jgi:protein gp37
MVKRSSIEWTDYSGGNANFVWRGSYPADCKVSAGCAHCYVDRIIARLGDRWPVHTTIRPEKLDALIKSRFNPKGEPFRRGPGSKPMVFVCDTGDLFHAAVPTDFIFQALDGFRGRRDVTWQLLTKRADRAEDVINTYCLERRLVELPSNIWFGVTAENQHWLQERGAALMRTSAAVKWLSCEPLLGMLDFNTIDMGLRGPDWVVVGGESGSQARPMHPDWVRRVRDACLTTGVSFFFKQWGEWKAADGPWDVVGWVEAGLDAKCVEGSPLMLWRIGRSEAGNELDGQYWMEFPL